MSHGTRPQGTATRSDVTRPWPTVVALVGPTASGKSAIALALAEQLGAEIVNADAFQLYRGMDIGTAKPSAAEQARVPHHLLDVLDVTETASVAEYQTAGRAALLDIAGRGRSAVVVGGSGLYVRALLDDLRFPGSDPEVRARWEAELARLGARGLHAVLAQRDPAAAGHILPTNGRRIVRALEVGELTGLPFPAVLPADGPPLVPHRSVGLHWERADLDQRIASRVRHMLDLGLAEEVRALLQTGLDRGRTASRALGYPQMIEVVAGRRTLADAEVDIVAATSAFARRQQRWFRRDPRTRWLPGDRSPLSTASEIVTAMAQTSK